MTKRNILFTALIAAAFAAPSAFAQEVDQQALRDAERAAEQSVEAADAANAAEAKADEAEAKTDEAAAAAEQAAEEAAVDEWPTEDEEEDPA